MLGDTWGEGRMELTAINIPAGWKTSGALHPKGTDGKSNMALGMCSEESKSVLLSLGASYRIKLVTNLLRSH